MSLEEVRAFVIHINAMTGRYPDFYSGRDIKRELGTHKDPVLVNCWFWLAQYRPTPIVTPNWNTWTMWQYTDGAVGPIPHTVAGIGRCDRNKFKVSETNLRKLWEI